MSEKDGGPAFPVQIGTQHDQHFAFSGMSLRDWFAGQCIEEMIRLSQHRDGGWCADTVASGCYLMADAMLKAREVKPHE